MTVPYLRYASLLAQISWHHDHGVIVSTYTPLKFGSGKCNEMITPYLITCLALLFVSDYLDDNSTGTRGGWEE